MIKKPLQFFPSCPSDLASFTAAIAIIFYNLHNRCLKPRVHFPN